MDNLIKEYRKNLGMTQEQLARMVDVSSRTIISLEKGQYKPSLLLAYKLSLVFHVTIEELFKLSENLERMEN
ncbi:MULTISPECIES: helix-turn-helix transcriptional regulator [Bacillus cereus group]|uniref:helix-turn-helix transcriptional regulator n=1 Tax=Bacillus cereus group TaxID=86661 RepID=UPI000BFC218A|nr:MULTISPECIES: helix-turn-helix transcriptional regulator [Bacillus cereus group]MCR6788086.1 helix-turn-helix transcriptional regulator [Bacillus thuringiensis]MCR6822228.1 helix-turn-helix transcriptional regulator [Bacillus thuringiensis]MCR6830162.1 helix-turn-helix transcriptional regulator [Bacillus thuringiensis]MEB8929358.1 helix-turn-helix transcriptional regulator [Bacillus cereus]MEB9327618.1 helix-turn-helix transcriptional regulator [Bacillus cereus]